MTSGGPIVGPPGWRCSRSKPARGCAKAFRKKGGGAPGPRFERGTPPEWRRARVGVRLWIRADAGPGDDEDVLLRADHSVNPPWREGDLPVLGVQAPVDL